MLWFTYGQILWYFLLELVCVHVRHFVIVYISAFDNRCLRLSARVPVVCFLSSGYSRRWPIKQFVDRLANLLSNQKTNVFTFWQTLNFPLLPHSCSFLYKAFTFPVLSICSSKTWSQQGVHELFSLFFYWRQSSANFCEKLVHWPKFNVRKSVVMEIRTNLYNTKGLLLTSSEA